MQSKVVFVLALLLSPMVYAESQDWRRVEALPGDQPASVSTPIFSQVVVFSIPPGWKRAYEKAADNSYILELLPQAESVHEWHDMITVQGFRGLATNPKATPAAFLKLVAAQVKQICGEQLVAQFLGPHRVDSYEARAAIIGCADMQGPAFGAKAGQGEVALYLAVKGREDFYIIHRAMRGEAFDKSQPPISPQNAVALLDTLGPIKLCERSEAPSACWHRDAR